MMPGVGRHDSLTTSKSFCASGETSPPTFVSSPAATRSLSTASSTALRAAPLSGSPRNFVCPSSPKLCFSFAATLSRPISSTATRSFCVASTLVGTTEIWPRDTGGFCCTLVGAAGSSMRRSMRCSVIFTVCFLFRR